jgi:hypothetical protein
MYSILKAAIADNIKLDKIVVRLEAQENTSDIFIETENNLFVSVLYPYFRNNVESERNRTCAVIALRIGDQKVIFSSDAPVDAWRTIIAHSGKKSLQILTVPHHGGNFATSENDREWFFENVNTKYAIVSTGYNNRYDHPRPEVIHSFVQNNTEIFCTQSNRICNSGFEIDANDIITCCGTIVADLSSQCTTIRDVVKLREIKNKFTKCLCQNESSANL